jgi:hypothetical protein
MDRSMLSRLSSDSMERFPLLPVKWYNLTFTGAAMKAKKTLKRLTRVEELLANVIEKCGTAERTVRELLDSAKTSVVSAKQAVDRKVSPKAAKKPQAKAETSKNRLSAEGRKKLSQAAKKRWAEAKRKGVSAVTGRPLTKTA